MAETFWCGGERVKFSNGATELLLAHWLARAESLSEQPGMDGVAAYLERRLRENADGWRAFGMDQDEFPDELAAAERVAALARLIEETARDAAQIPGISWDPDHRERWQSRLWRLHDALQAWGGRTVEREGQP